MDQAQIKRVIDAIPVAQLFQLGSLSLMASLSPLVERWLQQFHPYICSVSRPSRKGMSLVDWVMPISVPIAVGKGMQGAD